MKILYTTDLHGDRQYYHLIWQKAQEHKVAMVINGSDMLPKYTPAHFNQHRFIERLQDEYFPAYEKAGIHYLCTLGNDDLRIHDQFFDEVCDQFEFIHNIGGRCLEIGGYEFVGFNLVPDYPFGLKDRCRKDKEAFIFPRLLSKAQLSTPDGGWEWIGNWPKYAAGLPTIEDELNALPRPKEMSRAVYVIHAPPAGVGLDHCAGMDRPGSQAIYDYLLKNQPLLSLHGHLHRSYKLTGKWRERIKETWAVQPGQYGVNVSYVIIDLSTMAMGKFGHDPREVKR